jgi:hypothetical protein
VPIAPVPHPVQVSILDDDVVGAGRSLPGTVELNDDFTWHGVVERRANAVHALDEPAVHEQLEPRPDVEHFTGGTGRRLGHGELPVR